MRGTSEGNMERRMDEDERETLARLKQTREQLALRRHLQQRLLQFERELCRNNRFFPRTDILALVDAIAPMVRRTFPAGSVLYRGRVITKAEEETFLAPVYHALGVFVDGHDGSEDAFGQIGLAEAFVQSEIERLESGRASLELATLEEKLSSFCERGWWGFGKRESDAAPSDVTGNGRINPVGISYLYASSRRETAALEVRPVISQMVSVAEVVTTEDIILFDLTRHVFDDDDAPDDEARMFRKLLSHYFSKPNYSGDQAYLVTQYISEYIKGSVWHATGLRFDGIRFSSSLDRKGTNYVIFDTTESPKYEIVASSLEKVLDMRGTLETRLPMSDTAMKALMNGQF